MSSGDVSTSVQHGDDDGEAGCKSGHDLSVAGTSSDANEPILSKRAKKRALKLQYQQEKRKEAKVAKKEARRTRRAEGYAAWERMDPAEQQKAKEMQLLHVLPVKRPTRRSRPFVKQQLWSGRVKTNLCVEPSRL